MQLLPSLPDIFLSREAEESLPRQAWKLWVLGPQVSIETLELAIALGQLPFAHTKVHDDLVEDHGFALGHALFIGGQVNLDGVQDLFGLQGVLGCLC